MKLLLFILAVQFFGSNLAFASVCESEIGSCRYYQCRSQELGCVGRNYIDNFGAKYCNRYMKFEFLFRSPSRWVLHEIRTCLTQAYESNNTCNPPWSEVAREHSECYIQSGFCKLSKPEQAKIVGLLFTQLHRKALRQAGFDILNQCARRYWT